ncbi:hypothetical protein CNYM01_02144 [Colletotrichum nymphaeae SA-01]|uniref:Uncharacterized protein n=1 Tax=Colletotrichum nymphaeae SA-01 TaxID=1460502 RepID=A0A135TVY4_9PEZI|nr:hypothetical protein CNYM01_02144 [Colletotrichum nymphaeae SA-01]
MSSVHPQPYIPVHVCYKPIITDILILLLLTTAQRRLTRLVNEGGDNFIRSEASPVLAVQSGKQVLNPGGFEVVASVFRLS